MGEFVRIADLARNMIVLSGLVPEKDIAIEYTGLRPGEKMYEELVAYGEELQESGVPRLRVLRHANGIDRDEALWRDIEELIATARGHENQVTREKLWAVVRANDPDVEVTRTMVPPPGDTGSFPVRLQRLPTAT
jgi:FlaA1/EpsC-like NDP-sugar epimerase